ncbi:hypothetical protein FXO38_16880, partial [Capsicum annuum]
MPLKARRKIPSGSGSKRGGTPKSQAKPVNVEESMKVEEKEENKDKAVELKEELKGHVRGGWGGDEGRAGVGGRPRFGVRGSKGRRDDRVGRLRVGSWNIGTFQGSKARDVDGYKLWYSGSERRRNGVDILVDKELRGQVVEVKKISDRLMTIKLVIGGFTLNVCSVYAPQVGLDGEKMRFWEALDEVVRGVPSLEKIVALPGGFGNVHGGFGFGERNEEGATLLDFARTFGLVVVNSGFPKKEDHLITFRSAIAKTQIDFLLLRKGDRVLCK